MENLVKIQNELKVPKGNLNKFGNYKYRSAEDILEAVKPILLKYKCTLTLSDEIIAIGNKVFLKATAILNIDSKDVTVFGYAETSEHKGMSAEQTTGTASSYARKYALNGLFLIDETEQDADSKEPVKPAPVMTLEFATNLLKDCLAIDELATKYKSLSPDLQAKTIKIKDEMKIKLTPKTK